MKEINHRTRVAADKREKMRRKLIECALVVFSRKGVDAAVVDEVIALAEVSRGTFYNYFKSNDELLAAVVQEMGAELFWLIEQVVGDAKNPLERIATAIRLTLHTARSYPQFGNFFVRSNITAQPSDSLAHHFLMRDLHAAAASGKLKHAPSSVLLDLILGSALGGIHAVLSRTDAPADYTERLVFHVLLGLGVSPASAQKLVDRPLRQIEIPADSLLERSNTIESVRRVEQSKDSKK